MSGELKRVGVREFREGLAEYLASPSPVAVTRHGQTVGYFVPVRPKLDEQEVRALHEAVERLQKMMAEVGIDEEDVIRAYKARRRRG